MESNTPQNEFGDALCSSSPRHMEENAQDGEKGLADKENNRLINLIQVYCREDLEGNLEVKLDEDGLGTDDLNSEWVILGDEDPNHPKPTENNRVKNEENPDDSCHFQTNQVFDSREELIDWCQDVGKRIGMVVITVKSEKPSRGRSGRLILGCERGGNYRKHNKRIKGTPDALEARGLATKKCGCPFTLKGVPQGGDQWQMQVQFGLHNHERSSTVAGHSFAGRLNEKERRILEVMCKGGRKPQYVLNTLKEHNVDNKSNMRTIYNAKARLRTLEMQRRTDLQQTLKLLQEHNYMEWHTTDEEANEVTNIFCAHRDSVKLAKCFPSLLILDYTYKTNRYGMPLLEIAGVTSTGKTFSIAFVFMESESEETYVWALSRLQLIFDPEHLPAMFVTNRELSLMNAIDRTFPNCTRLLGTWQIMKKVEANCKEHFETNEEWHKFIDEWAEVMKSETESAFNAKLSEFGLHWAQFPTCVEYLRDTWLPHKEQFVCAWTNRLRHYGQTIMGREQSACSSLRNCLPSSQGTFTTVWSVIHSMIPIQLTEVHASFVQSLTTSENSHMLDLFNKVRGRVSHLAIETMLLEYARGDLIGTESTRCGCVLPHTHGLPCTHHIKIYEHENKPISLSAVDSHWKQLSNLPTPVSCSEFEYQPEVVLLRKSWEESNEDERIVLMKRLREIACPSTTTMDGPSTPAKGKRNVKHLNRMEDTAETCLNARERNMKKRDKNLLYRLKIKRRQLANQQHTTSIPVKH